MHSQAEESIQFGDLKIASLLFANDVVLFAASDWNLQHPRGGLQACVKRLG